MPLAPVHGGICLTSDALGRQTEAKQPAGVLIIPRLVLTPLPIKLEPQRARRERRQRQHILHIADWRLVGQDAVDVLALRIVLATGWIQAFPRVVQRPRPVELLLSVDCLLFALEDDGEGPVLGHAPLVLALGEVVGNEGLLEVVDEDVCHCVVGVAGGMQRARDEALHVRVARVGPLGDGFRAVGGCDVEFELERRVPVAVVLIQDSFDLLGAVAGVDDGEVAVAELCVAQQLVDLGVRPREVVGRFGVLPQLPDLAAGGFLQGSVGW